MNTLKSEPETRFVQANGLRYAYLEEGQGPLVLLLHGFPDTAQTWDDVRPVLAKAGFRAVSPFLRGYAPTEIPKTDTDTRVLAQDVSALISALGESKAIVVGHDWGAETAQACATLAPEKVVRLVMVAIPHRMSVRLTPRLGWKLRHFVALKLPGAVARFARNDFAGVEVLTKRWSPTWQPAAADLGPVKQTFAVPGSLDAAVGYYRAASFLPPPWLRASISAPTLAIAGKDDPGIRPEDFEKARPFFKGTYRVVSIPGGHFCHRESPQAFAAALLEFFSGS